MKQTSNERYGRKETEQRLQLSLRGAFSGPPTPLKDIPKKNGESRATAVGKKKAPPKRG